MFDSLNTYENLNYLESASAEELKNMIQSIKLPSKIISIYALGSRHYAWVQTNSKIVKENKKSSKEK